MLATESGARRGGEVKRRNADSSVWAPVARGFTAHTRGRGGGADRQTGKRKETAIRITGYLIYTERERKINNWSGGGISFNRWG